MCKKAHYRHWLQYKRAIWEIAFAKHLDLDRNEAAHDCRRALERDIICAIIIMNIDNSAKVVLA